MDNKTITSWIMYHEVQKLQRDGLSVLAIAKYLAIILLTASKCDMLI